MVARPPAGGLPRASHVLGIFNGTAGTHSSSCLYRQPNMRLFLRRRRYPEPSRPREIHSSRQRAKNPQQSSKVQWFSIPVSVGVGVVGLVQLYKTYKTRATNDGDGEDGARPGDKQANERDEIREDNEMRPRKRPRIRPDGPWQVRVMSTLPLKAISRLWGWFNELTIPYYLRKPGFKLYSYIFGVNLDEVAEPDLRTYKNLAAFFYRTLRPGVRPLDPRSDSLLSPSDGRLLQFGQIEGNDIEQVKGMTYTIDALLGKNTPPPSLSGTHAADTADSEASYGREFSKDEELVNEHEEFAKLNDISYTLPNLFAGASKRGRKGSVRDETVSKDSASAVSAVEADLARGDQPWYDTLSPEKKTALYYAVIYLAPGDYHRFHSPANWVVERRRHFAGELYSVSPYLQRTLPGLFTLNERVVLLGRWRWGFFSYVPVGATNVGSIKINFDKELRTNSLLTDTAAARAAEEAALRGEQYGGFSEATYASASPVLHGHAVRRGEEMGGFQLGSTIVLVFEAPVERRTESGERLGWVWEVEKGQRVKMGQALGCTTGV